MPDAGGSAPHAAPALTAAAAAFAEAALHGLRARPPARSDLLPPPDAGIVRDPALRLPADRTLPAGALAYGYPLWLEADGHAAPLLSHPLGRDRFGAWRLDGPARLNLALLDRLGVAPEQVVLLRAGLADAPGAAFAQAPALLDRIGRGGLQAATGIRAGDPGRWVDHAALLSADAAATGDTLGRIRRLARRGAGGGALGAWLADARPDRMPAAGPVWDPVGIGADLRAELAGIAGHPLAVVALPPAGHALDLAVVLAASAAMQGGSVLYVAPRPEAAGRFARRFGTVAAAEATLAVDLAGHPAPAGGLAALAAAIARLAAAPAGRAARGGPSERDVRDWDRTAPDLDAARADLQAAHDALQEIEEATARARAALPAGWGDAKAAAIRLPVPAGTMADWLAGRARPEPAAAAAALRRIAGTLEASAAPPPTGREAVRLLLDLARWQQLRQDRLERLGRLARLPGAGTLRHRRIAHEQGLVALTRPLLQAALVRRATAAAPVTVPRLHRMAGAAGPFAAADVVALRADLPVWAATPEALDRLLPEVLPPFDLLLLDDAEAVPAALLPLLLDRADRCVLFGRPDGGTPLLPSAIGGAADGSALAAATPRGPCVRPARATGQHPALIDWLSRRFHAGRLVPAVDLDRLAEGCPPGVPGGFDWQDVAGEVEATSAGPADPGQARAAVRLLQAWDRAGHFAAGTRLRVAVAAALPGVPPQVRRLLMRADLPQRSLDRIAVGTVEWVARQRFDAVVLLPGLAGNMPARVNAALAGSAAVFHDAIAAARVLVHVIADRQAAHAAGGHAAALAGLVAPDTPDLPPPALTRLLDRAGLVWQCGATIDGVALPLRVLGAFGGSYALVVDGGADVPAAGGHRVVRIDREEIDRRGGLLAERLARLV